MNQLDPVTTGLVTAGALQLAKQAQDFIAAVMGRPGESLGTILGNIGNRRLQNMGDVTERSHLILLNLNLDPKDIPLPVLHPALEGASLQEDPSMQELWSNLLANAADPREMVSVLPTFVSILKELIPAHATILNTLYDQTMAIAASRMMPSDVTYSMVEIKRAYDGVMYPRTAGQNVVTTAFGNDFVVLVAVLTRHRILFVHHEVITVNATPNEVVDPRYSFTELGLSFVKACREPK